MPGAGQLKLQGVQKLDNFKTKMTSEIKITETSTTRLLEAARIPIVLLSIDRSMHVYNAHINRFFLII